MEGTSRKRPWLAAVFGTLVTGAGHVYLRRWKRAFGWLFAAFAAAVVFVPTEDVQAFVDGTGSVEPLLPVFAVVLTSALDAYLVARAQNEEARRSANSDGSITHCPACGKELDGDIDFCPWCTTELDGARVVPNDDETRRD